MTVWVITYFYFPDGAIQCNFPIEDDRREWAAYGILLFLTKLAVPDEFVSGDFKRDASSAEQYSF